MTADPKSSRISVPQVVLPLPGHLDETPVFISNSPEIVLQAGILVSTFAPGGKSNPSAHLDYPLSGRFDIFFHHITDIAQAASSKTLFLGLLIGNSSDDEVHLRVLNAVSYLTRNDAPFLVLDAVIDNSDAKTYAGPGDRVMLDLLCNAKLKDWDDCITLRPRETKVVCSLPLPVNALFHQRNGRTGFISLDSDRPVQVALLSAFAEGRGIWSERKPELNDWMNLLNTASLVQPRDKQPTPPNAAGELIYGRTAGVARGSIWRGAITNDETQSRFLAREGQLVSYPISTVRGGTLGTNQIQAAPLAVRYPDTAYMAHGNYSVLYDLVLPIYNPTETELLIGLTFQSPLKSCNETTELRFLREPPNSIVFRGNIKFQWKDKNLEERSMLIHLVQKQGQMQDSLVELELPPKWQIDVNVSLRYPPDCTPPQVLTISAKANQEGSHLRQR
jgi:hypothetical protein